MLTKNIFVTFPLAIVQVICGQGHKGNLETNAGELPPVTPPPAPGARLANDISQASEYKVDSCNISHSPTSREAALKEAGAALAHLTLCHHYYVCL